MSEPKRYVLATVADFTAVPEGKLADCLIDFIEWLRVMRWAAEHPELVVGVVDEPGLSNQRRFVWIDDGAHHVTVGIRRDGEPVGELAWDVDVPE